MPFAYNIPFFTIMISMLAGIITLAMKGRHAEKVALTTMALVAGMSFYLLFSLMPDGVAFTYMMGHYPAPWGNELRAGFFEAIMAVTFTLVIMLSLIAGRRSVFRDIPEKRQGIYYLMVNLLLSSLLVLIYTNDIFTAYVFVEINTIAACSIIVAKDTGETVTATIRYLVMSMLGSGLFLIAISLLYDLTGHLLMPNIMESVQILVAEASYTLPLSVIVLLVCVGLAIKSALYPFHTWLPAAHGSATSASSGILSGVVLKGYIVLLLKFFYRVIGLETIRRLGVADILFVFGLIGMIMGSVHAIREKNIKRMIAYSSVAQIGYIYMGIGLSTFTGIVAAAFHILAHAFTKPMLFSATDGLMIVSNHSKNIADLKGAGYRNILAGVAFTVGTLSMIGIPFFSGFVSKVYFASASIDNPEKMVLTLLVLALSTVLNALYYFPVLVTIYTYQGELDHHLAWYCSNTYKVTMILFIAANVFLGVSYIPVVRLLETGLSVF